MRVWLRPEKLGNENTHDENGQGADDGNEKGIERTRKSADPTWQRAISGSEAFRVPSLAIEDESDSESRYKVGD